MYLQLIWIRRVMLGEQFQITNETYLKGFLFFLTYFILIISKFGRNEELLERLK